MRLAPKSSRRQRVQRWMEFRLLSRPEKWIDGTAESISEQSRRLLRERRDVHVNVKAEDSHQEGLLSSLRPDWRVSRGAGPLAGWATSGLGAQVEFPPPNRRDQNYADETI